MTNNSSRVLANRRFKITLRIKPNRDRGIALHVEPNRRRVQRGDFDSTTCSESSAKEIAPYHRREEWGMKHTSECREDRNHENARSGGLCRQTALGNCRA